jgi:hypothetical protein
MVLMVLNGKNSQDGNDTRDQHRDNGHPEPGSLGPSFRICPIDAAVVEDHAIIVQSPANMRRLLALLSSIVHAILTDNRPKSLFQRLKYQCCRVCTTVSDRVSLRSSAHGRQEYVYLMAKRFS